MTPVEPVTGRAYVRPMDPDLPEIDRLRSENESLRRTLAAVAALAQAGAMEEANGDRAVTTRPAVTSAAENSPSADHAA